MIRNSSPEDSPNQDQIVGMLHKSFIPTLEKNQRLISRILVLPRNFTEFNEKLLRLPGGHPKLLESFLSSFEKFPQLLRTFLELHVNFRIYSGKFAKLSGRFSELLGKSPNFLESPLSFVPGNLPELPGKFLKPPR